MKTFLSDIIPKIQKYSQKLDNLALLTNQHWIVIDEVSNSKTVYIFRSNNDLLISVNGKVQKARWEFLGNDSLLIETKDEMLMFKHGFFNKEILALQLDGQQGFALLLNEAVFSGESKSFKEIEDYLVKTYTLPDVKEKPALEPQKEPVIIEPPKKEILKELPLSKELLDFNYTKTLLKSGSGYTGSYEKFMIVYEGNLSGEFIHMVNLNYFYFKEGHTEHKFHSEEDCIKSLYQFCKRKSDNEQIWKGIH